MDYQYHNYKRLTLIIQELQELEKYRPAEMEMVKYYKRWGLRYEEITGTDAMLRQFIMKSPPVLPWQGMISRMCHPAAF